MTDNDQRHRRALEQIAEIKRAHYALEHALERQKPAAVLITSAVQGEGKSLLAAAIAASASLGGSRRVLVMDLNWYRPALHGFFGIERGHPLTAFVERNLSELVAATVTGTTDVLCAPLDYREGQEVNGNVAQVGHRLIEQAKSQYDLVVIDSASIYPTNRMMMDPVMLAGMADGVAMVVLAGVTPRQQAKKAQKVLEIAGANLLGVITNQRQAARAK